MIASNRDLIMEFFLTIIFFLLSCALGRFLLTYMGFEGCTLYFYLSNFVTTMNNYSKMRNTGNSCMLCFVSKSTVAWQEQC